jgi:hypothetical protein
MTTSTKTSPLGADARDPPLDYSLILTFAAIVVRTTLVNSPFFHLEESDDAFYTLVAHSGRKAVRPMSAPSTSRRPASSRS